MSLVLPFGSMVVGFVGALFSASPAVAILSSAALRRRPMFQTMASLALNETMFLLGCGVVGLLNVTGHSTLPPFLCALLHRQMWGLGRHSSRGTNSPGCQWDQKGHLSMPAGHGTPQQAWPGHSTLCMDPQTKPLEGKGGSGAWSHQH